MSEERNIESVRAYLRAIESFDVEQMGVLLDNGVARPSIPTSSTQRARCAGAR